MEVNEISLTLNSNGALARRWHTDVQPLIKRDQSRPDANWNWPFNIIPIVLFGHPHRRGRIFQITLGTERRPAAMIAVLTNERWCLDPQKSAAFVFYLSAAPAAWLGMHDASGNPITPKMVGQATLDVALCIALNECDGRLWLHAAPQGGTTLLNWYQHCGLQLVDPGRHSSLPGFIIGRINDGRYLCIEGDASRQAYAAHSQFR